MSIYSSLDVSHTLILLHVSIARDRAGDTAEVQALF